jgi:hypothetical protein
VNNTPEIYFGRLLTGAAINVVLLLMMPAVARWSSVEREFRLTLTAAALGTVAIVCVTRVLLRANYPERVFAGLLLILPVIALWLVWAFIVTYK